MALASTLQRRLIFVSGKGGVGKTTVALGLGLAAARQGRRCLLVEIDTAGLIPARFGKAPGVLGRPIELRPGLSSMVVEGRAALDEYLGLLLPAAVLKPIQASKVYNYFVAGAPGLQELMCMGKIFYEAERAEHGRLSWDLIIVDAPSTGHGVEMYRMPQAAHDTFSMGLVHRETNRILNLLRDPALTLHILVTLAEELPVSETLELAKAVTEDLKFPLGAIVVNRFYPAVLSAAAALELQGAKAELTAASPLLAELVERTEMFHSEHEENTRQLERIRSSLKLDPVVLPALFEKYLLAEQLDPLVRALEEQLQ